MYKVLIADNQPIVRLGLTDLINHLPDFTVIAQEDNGIDTLMRIEQGDIDLLIMELSMPPGEHGQITIKRIHDHFPNVRILVFSTQEDQTAINQALHNGAMGYILKSSATNEIIAGLNHLAMGERYLDNNIMITKKDLAEIKNGSQEIDLKGYNGLSKREQELFPLFALGYTNKEIANKLYISTKTVEAHKANINHKLHLNGHADLVRYALNHHLIDLK